MLEVLKKYINIIIVCCVLLAVLCIGSIQKGWNISGVFLGLFFTGCYVSLVICAWKAGGIIDDLKNSSKKELGFLIFMVIFINVCLMAILLKEKYVRFWDYVGYWVKAVTMSDLLVTDPKRLLSSLYSSINTDNYNNLIPSVMALPLKILGYNFSMYVTVIFNMFLIPSFITIIYTVKRVLQKAGQEFHPLIVCLFVITMPVLIQPVLYGYLDAFAFVNFSLLILLLCSDVFEQLNIKRDILIAVLILLCLMGRRYFAYAIIGYALCVAFICLRNIIISKELKVLKHYLIHGLVIAVSFFGVILLGFVPFLQQSFSGTVAVNSAAYQKGDQLLNYRLAAVRYGYLFVLLGILGCAYLLYKKKCRKYGVCVLMGVFIPATLFYGMQSMNMHHYYITAVPILLCIAISLNVICNKKAGKIAVLILLVISVTLSFDGIRVTGTVAKAFSEVKLVAKCRGDMSELQRMAADVKKEAEDGNTTYVLASTDILSDDILRRIDMPDAFTITSKLLATNHVDLRHGFPENFFDADIVIATSPVQAHLGVDNQHIIGDLANEFINHGPLEKNYQMIETYYLDNNVEAYMYRRICEIPQSDREYLRDIFDGYYPDYPELFHDRIK